MATWLPTIRALRLHLSLLRIRAARFRHGSAELITATHAHNFVPAPWACLDSFGLALRAETTDRDDRCLHVPSVGRFSASSVAERSRPSAIAPARSPFRYR